MKSMDIYNSATQTHRQRAVPVRPHRCRPRFSSHSNLKSESWSLIHTETSPIICQSLHNAMRFWNDLLLSALLMQSVFLQNTLSSIPFHQQQYATYIFQHVWRCKHTLQKEVTAYGNSVFSFGHTHKLDSSVYLVRSSVRHTDSQRRWVLAARTGAMLPIFRSGCHTDFPTSSLLCAATAKAHK